MQKREKCVEWKMKIWIKEVRQNLKFRIYRNRITPYSRWNCITLQQVNDKSKIESLEPTVGALLHLISPQKLKILGFNKTTSTESEMRDKANKSLPKLSVENSRKMQDDKETQKLSFAGLPQTQKKSVILESYLGTVAKIPENKEKAKDKISEKSESDESFLGTNNKLFKSRQDLAEYDEFLRNEREKVRQKTEELEFEHRKIVKEKYKPTAHSFFKIDIVEKKKPENIAENFMEKYWKILGNKMNRNSQFILWEIIRKISSGKMKKRKI